MPLGYTVTGGDGPIIEFVDLHRAPWHKDKAIQLLKHEGYDSLVEYFTKTESNPIPDGGTSQPPKFYCWFHSDGQNKQPIIDDLGVGQLNYFFKTENDANRFMKEYMKQYGITDLSNYERVEVALTQVDSGIELEEKILTPEHQRELEIETEDNTEKTEQEAQQAGISDY